MRIYASPETRICEESSPQITRSIEFLCKFAEVCCKSDEVCCKSQCSAEVCCKSDEVCDSQSSGICKSDEDCCVKDDSRNDRFKVLIDGLIEKANDQVEAAKSRLRTLVELNPIKLGANIISFSQGVKTTNTKTSFTIGEFSITCFRDKVVVVIKDNVSCTPLVNPRLIYTDEHYVVVLSEIDDECCMASAISTRAVDEARPPNYKYDSFHTPVGNPETSPVVHQFVDGMVRSMSYDVNVLAGAAPRFIDDMVFKATPACVSGSLICDSQYSYIIGHDHVYSKFYNPFTGKCLMFDQSGVTHEYGSVFTKDGIHVEVDSSYLY